MRRDRQKHRRTRTSYTDIFSNRYAEIGKTGSDAVVAITAAMPDGTGLKRFRKMFPDRFFDVGIAEEHAVTFAAGLAAGRLKAGGGGLFVLFAAGL